MHQTRIRWGYYYTFGVANTPDLGQHSSTVTIRTQALLLSRALLNDGGAKAFVNDGRVAFSEADR